MLSDEIVRKCFPNRECVIYNLDVAISLKEYEGDEMNRIHLLCECYQAIRDNNVPEAVRLAKLADYQCMSQAIELYFS